MRSDLWPYSDRDHVNIILSMIRIESCLELGKGLVGSRIDSKDHSIRTVANSVSIWHPSNEQIDLRRLSTIEPERTGSIGHVVPEHRLCSCVGRTEARVNTLS